jgi:predicted protein tyrosine phosphatase
MLQPIKSLKKASNIIVRRLREQGVGITLIWLYGRGIPLITGIPIMKYSEITPHLYIGAQYNQRGKRKLEQEGIKHDVNLRIEFDDAAHDLALEHYCYLPTIDDDAPTMQHLKQGAAFIEQAINNGEKVYIHCAGGIGRAPTMAAAYFISQGMSLDEAIALIKKSRPFIKIMPPQLAQLKHFEEGRGQ